MRKDWEVKKLGDICEIVGGSTPKTNIPEFWDGEYYWVTPAEVNERYISSTIRTITEKGVRSANLKLLPKGTVLFTSRAPIGKVAIAEVPMYCNQGFKNLICSDRLLNKYLYWFLIYNIDYIRSLGRGATFKEISKQILSSVKILLPSFHTQVQIAEELDCLTSIIEKQKKQLEELDNLAQSIFYDMFGDPIENEKGWNPSTIDNVCSSIIRGPFGSALKKDYFVEKDDSTYKVYEQKNAINKNAFIGTYYIPKEMYDSLSRFEVFPNDIIMSCSGTIGELFVIPYEAERGIINQALLKFTLNNKIEQYYFLFMMGLMKSKLDVKGCGIQNIGSVKYIKATIFGLPPLPLQQQFAAKIEAIEKQKELIKKSIKETEDLFNSRMEYYFN